MNRITKIWKFIIANLDTVVALLVSAVATTFGIIQNNQELLLAGVGLTLTFLAVGLIRDRHHRETLNDQLAKLDGAIVELSTEKINSSNFFYPRSNSTDLPLRLRKAKYTLDVMGPSLSSIGITHQAILRELKNNGVKIRILVSNPDNTHLQEFFSMRFLEADTAPIHARHVKGTLSSLSQIVGFSSSGGSVEIHITNHVLSFSYIGSDVGKSEGEIQVEFYLTKTGLDRDPMFLLKQPRDAHWFTEFRGQFDLLWENSTAIDPKGYV